MIYTHLPISSLIEKCVQKEPMAWAEFINRYSPLITFSIKKALATYSSQSAAEEEMKDIRQDIIVSLWNKNKLNEIRQRENINYWLAIIARNAAINYLKTKGKEILIGEETYFEKFTPKETREPETWDYDKNVNAVYGPLTPREKIMFTLYFKKGFGLKDMSKILNIPIGTLSAAVTRMKKKIRKNH